MNFVFTISNRPWTSIPWIPGISGRGSHNYQGKDLEFALGMAHELKRAYPEDPEVSHPLGGICYQKGISRSALEQLEFAAGWRPGDALVHFHLGMTYFQLQERQTGRCSSRGGL